MRSLIIRQRIQMKNIHYISFFYKTLKTAYPVQYQQLLCDSGSFRPRVIMAYFRLIGVPLWFCVVSIHYQFQSIFTFCEYETTQPNPTPPTSSYIKRPYPTNPTFSYFAIHYPILLHIPTFPTYLLYIEPNNVPPYLTLVPISLLYPALLYPSLLYHTIPYYIQPCPIAS